MSERHDIDSPQARPSPRRIWLKVLTPVAIGLAVIGWLFLREFTPETWDLVDFTPRVVLCRGLL